MMISSIQVQNLLSQYKKDNSKGGVGSSSTVVKGGRDEFHVSQDAQNYITAREALRNVPDVRDEKINSLKQQIKTGSYSVSNDDIAEKMIERSLVDTLV